MITSGFLFRYSKLNRSGLFVLCLSVLTITSCQKGEMDEFEQPAPLPAENQHDDYVPVYPDADAVMVSIKTISFENQGGNLYEQSAGSARAIFPSKTGTLVNAGEVRVENQPLNCETGNQYNYQPNTLAPQGIPFTNNKPRWSVSGNSNIPNMNFMNTTGFPEISPIAGDPETIDRTTEFTLGFTDPVINADSVRYTIISANGFIYSAEKGTSQSHTFSPEQLQLLDPGSGSIKITSFRTVTMFINQKNIQAINQTVISKKIILL